MPRLRTMLLLALTLPPLAGCATSARIDTRPVAELVSAGPPAELARSCDSPSQIPKGVLAAGPVERLWARDRANLAECRDRHKAAIGYFAERDAGLAGRR